MTLNEPVFKTISKQQEDELLSYTRLKLNKMFQDKKQTPSLIIPKNLLSFAKTDQFKRFVISIFLYCQEFNKLIKKYDILKEKMKSRANDETILLQKEKQTLFLMEKELSYQYAAILLMNANGGGNKDQKEQFFFETLIYLISKVIKELFPREQFNLIEQEINRLFRTNRFNIIKRRHEKDQIMKDFPVLKDPTNKQRINLQTIINKAPEQIVAYKHLERELKRKRKPNSTHDYSHLMGIEQIRDEQQRSPLICTWLPSRKNMLVEFNRPNYASHLKVSSNNRTRIASMALQSNTIQQQNQQRRQYN